MYIICTYNYIYIRRHRAPTHPTKNRLRRQDRENADLVLHFPSISSSSSTTTITPGAVTLRGRLLRPHGALDVAGEERRRQALAEGVAPEAKPRILTLGLNPCVQKVGGFCFFGG